MIIWFFFKSNGPGLIVRCRASGTPAVAGVRGGAAAADPASPIHRVQSLAAAVKFGLPPPLVVDTPLSLTPPLVDDAFRRFLTPPCQRQGVGRYAYIIYTIHIFACIFVCIYVYTYTHTNVCTNLTSFLSMQLLDRSPSCRGRLFHHIVRFCIKIRPCC